MPEFAKNQLATVVSYFRKHKFSILISLLYGVIVITLAVFHEVWRDEARALNIVISSHSLIDLFKNLHNEGHPILWYLLLYWGYALTHANVILKVINLVISIAAIYIFTDRAPLPKWQKLLFVFSYFPIYEYSVINRNYAISMLLLFIFATLYRDRFKKIIPISLTLFLLANTNAYALIIVCAFWLALLAEFVYLKYQQQFITDSKKIYFSFILVFLGMLAAFIQIMPDHSTTVLKTFHQSLLSILWAALKLVFYPGYSFVNLLNFPLIGIVFCLTAYSLYFYLVSQKKYFLLLSFFISVSCLELFLQFGYFGGIRHLGFFYLLIVLFFWLSKPETDTLNKSNFSVYIERLKNSLFVVLFFISLVQAVLAISLDLWGSYSSSKYLAKFLSQHPELKNAIIIGQPDYALESLPYYDTNHANSIFVVRENKFSTKTNITTASKKTLSLDELVAIAEKLHQEQQRPVIFTIGYQLVFKHADSVEDLSATFGQHFIYTRQMVDDFYSKTQLILPPEPAITDENYKVYLLK